MIRLLWAGSVHTRDFLRRYMPTNILLDLIRTRRGLKWGVPAMLLAVPYLLAASICTHFIANGAPRLAKHPCAPVHLLCRVSGYADLNLWQAVPGVVWSA
ncbi:hypothetical protein [Cumulibacter manganitolerans]|uniref:hypothetical protein n=1 Tax=Cumulibacter manganitolerans TaxID=1884992 RepID=UPI001E65C75C|nr:hypothetical protein [Cumulibacter manganitolerans]